MIVALLVLVGVLLSIVAIIVSFYPRPRVIPLDGNGVNTAAQLDAAMAIQRSERLKVSQRRLTDRNIWPFALLGVGLLMQMGALAVDRLAHPSIAVLTTLPAFFILLTARASRRREAQRQLDALVRRDSTAPTV